MAVVQQNSYGKIVYSDEFLSNLAGLATMDCYGIVGMSSQKAMDGIVELLKGKTSTKESSSILKTTPLISLHHRRIRRFHCCCSLQRDRHRQIQVENNWPQCEQSRCHDKRHPGVGGSAYASRITGELFKEMVLSAAAYLEKNKKEPQRDECFSGAGRRYGHEYVAGR